MTRRAFLPPAAALAAGASLAGNTVSLPQPRLTSEIPLEDCLMRRRSVRTYRNGAVSVDEIAQLLWAAQGITSEGYLRTAPSAGALYPLELYLVGGKVDGLSPGLYRYRPERHELVLIKPGDIRFELARAAMDQDCVRNAPATILFAAVYARTSSKYGQRGMRYVHMEAGHSAQNVCLQAAALALGVVTVGAFHDGEVKRVAGLPETHDPIYLMPLGRK